MVFRTAIVGRVRLGSFHTGVADGRLRVLAGVRTELALQGSDAPTRRRDYNTSMGCTVSQMSNCLNRLLSRAL